MRNLADLSMDELKALAVSLNERPFRAGQLYKWVHLFKPYEDMTDIPKGFKELLGKDFYELPLSEEKTLKSKDGSEKYLFRFRDGQLCEGVFIPNNYGNTVCVSTQIGCKMGCKFCASGRNGIERNLTAGEILGQAAFVNALKGGDLQKRQITNIVLMGSGEPLDNYENVKKFIDLATAKEGLNFGQRNITVSTCGLADKIKTLADDGYSVMLSISLHSTTDEARREIMPIANKYSIKETVDAAKYYFDKTGRRITYEYTMISKKNMTFFDVKRLAEITKGYPAHINLIPLNPSGGDEKLSAPQKRDADIFLRRLLDAGISASVRISAGSDIGGACGQLRAKYVENCRHD